MKRLLYLFWGSFLKIASECSETAIILALGASVLSSNLGTPTEFSKNSGNILCFRGPKGCVPSSNLGTPTRKFL